LGAVIVAYARRWHFGGECSSNERDDSKTQEQAPYLILPKA
jgi:hypothetical protein